MRHRRRRDRLLAADPLPRWQAVVSGNYDELEAILARTQATLDRIYENHARWGWTARPPLTVVPDAGVWPRDEPVDARPRADVLSLSVARCARAARGAS